MSKNINAIIKNPEKLSEESVLFHILNYGNWQDVRDFIKIKGLKETASLFYKTLNKKRNNYLPQIKNYFKKYFQKHTR